MSKYKHITPSRFDYYKKMIALAKESGTYKKKGIFAKMIGISHSTLYVIEKARSFAEYLTIIRSFPSNKKKTSVETAQMATHGKLAQNSEGKIEEKLDTLVSLVQELVTLKKEGIEYSKKKAAERKSWFNRV